MMLTFLQTLRCNRIERNVHNKKYTFERGSKNIPFRKTVEKTD